MAEKLYHFSHQLDESHYFSLTLVFDIPCSFCGLSIGGIGYACGGCWTFMHESCAELPQHIDHSLHPLHQPLTLLNIRSSNATTTTCYYCDETFQSHERWAYACNQCSLYMHITCALIPLPTIRFKGHQESDVAQYVCHEHQMSFVADDDDGRKGQANCFACQSQWSGPAYSCTSATCQNFIHKSCAEWPQKIQHPFHSHHLLTLQLSKSPSCRCCCKKGYWLIFRCEENGCNFSLCIECASDRKNMVHYRSHEHSLFLVENVKASWDIQCDACQKPYKKRFNHNFIPDEVGHTKSSLFRCMECDFNLHFLCGPLPSVVTYDCHVHCLTLVDNYANEDDFDESYCDICEEKMNTHFRIYCCEVCKYLAHIRCLKYEIMKILNKKDTDTSNDVQFWALKEDLMKFFKFRVEVCISHIASLTRTSRNIMDALSQQEKETLIHPFANYTSVFKSRHDYYRKLNSEFDELGSIDHFDRLMQFLQIKDYTIENFSDEIWWYTGEEGGLKVKENYLRQEVVEVSDDINGGNYKVMIPETLAPIFKTLLLKCGHHDDLRGRSGLTDGMRSVGSTLLSIVIDKMCRTKVEDVTMDHLKQWHFYLLGIQRITGFNLERYMYFLRRNLVHAYLGFKAIRSEKEMRENLDLRIAGPEDELQRRKKNREELETMASQKSSEMKDCLNKASALKGKTVVDKWF
ncbi:Zinc finger, PHD-type [Trema orientale]|uniref:Zinc finger, PHD-type n=1 Tax=Trema orientale TaxID=63057 RepID=A0A2P5FKQ0_TREOI|nr:Zinc finger, PHD-type [Trema orientale]